MMYGGEVVALKRIIAQLDEKLVEQIEAYAMDMHLSRTAAITVLLTTALKQEKTMNTLNELVNMVNDMKALQPEMNEQD